jgi:hypothetical protein
MSAWFQRLIIVVFSSGRYGYSTRLRVMLGFVGLPTTRRNMKRRMVVLGRTNEYLILELEAADCKRGNDESWKNR